MLIQSQANAEQIKELYKSNNQKQDEMEKIKNKLKRLKASNTIIKFFKSSTHGNGKNFPANADDILTNAPEKKEGFFIVTKVIE